MLCWLWLHVIFINVIFLFLYLFKNLGLIYKVGWAMWFPWGGITRVFELFSQVIQKRDKKYGGALQALQANGLKDFSFYILVFCRNAWSAPCLNRVAGHFSLLVSRFSNRVENVFASSLDCKKWERQNHHADVKPIRSQHVSKHCHFEATTSLQLFDGKPSNGLKFSMQKYFWAKEISK